MATTIGLLGATMQIGDRVYHNKRFLNCMQHYQPGSCKQNSEKNRDIKADAND